jgi:hypothetical protein
LRFRPFSKSTVDRRVSGAFFVFKELHIVSTEAQIAANQQNSQKSTGPVTEEGKAAVSQNRISHGMTGRFRLLGWEDGEQFEQLVTSIYNEQNPPPIPSAGWWNP